MTFVKTHIDITLSLPTEGIATGQCYTIFNGLGELLATFYYFREKPEHKGYWVKE